MPNDSKGKLRVVTKVHSCMTILDALTVWGTGASFLLSAKCLSSGGETRALRGFAGYASLKVLSSNLVALSIGRGADLWEVTGKARMTLTES